MERNRGRWRDLDDSHRTGRRAGIAHLVPLSCVGAGTPAAAWWRAGIWPTQVQRLARRSKGKATLDKDSGVKDWRLHDLRRTLATGLQRLGVRLEVTEAVLNHVSGSRAGIVGNISGMTGIKRSGMH